MCKVDKLLDEADELTEAADFNKLQKIWSGREYTMDDGKVVMKVMYDDVDLEIIHAQLEAGSAVPSHMHSHKETYSVCAGSIIIKHNERTVLLERGDTYYISARISHSVSSEKGAKVMVIRVPSSGEFNGR